MKISYQNNISNNDFDNFSAFLANFNSFGDFTVCFKAPFSDILCHVEATHLTFNGSQLTGMMRAFTERPLRADFHFSLNVNVNVTVDSYMSSTSQETILRNFLQ